MPSEVTLNIPVEFGREQGNGMPCLKCGCECNGEVLILVLEIDGKKCPQRDMIFCDACLEKYKTQED